MSWDGQRHGGIVSAARGPRRAKELVRFRTQESAKRPDWRWLGTKMTRESPGMAWVPAHGRSSMKINLPIDTSAVSFIDVMPPEPVLDGQTKQQEADANGE